MEIEGELEYYPADEIEDFELTQEELLSIDVDDELGEYYVLQDEDSDPDLIRRREQILAKMIRSGKLAILPTREWRCGDCGQENTNEDSLCSCCGVSYSQFRKHA